MSELAKRVARARSAFREWDENRIPLVEAKLASRAQRARSFRVAAGVVAGLVLVGLGGLVVQRNGPRAGAESGAGPGFSAELLDAASSLRTIEWSPSLTVVEVVAGKVRFDVSHREGRTFRVLAGNTLVEVLGTRFTVERLGDAAHVAVEHGRVLVSWPGANAELGGQDSGRFPHALPQVEHPPAVVAGPRARSPQPRAQVGVLAATPDWKTLATQGQMALAYDRLEANGFAVADNVDDLLLAADLARQTRHPAGAVPLLKRVVEQHGGDPRAALAAFTLGRVLLDDLSRPADAAASFQRVRQLDPSGALAEDALAREAEGWARAGSLERARSIANEYLRLYPQGSRLSSMKKYGAFE